MTKSERVRSELERVRHAIGYRVARREAFIKAIARWTEDVKKLKKQEARLQARLKTVVAEELGSVSRKVEPPKLEPKPEPAKDETRKDALEAIKRHRYLHKEVAKLLGK